MPFDKAKYEGVKNGKKMVLINHNLLWRWETYDPEMPNKLVRWFNSKQWKDSKKYPTIEWFRIKHKIPPTTWHKWVDKYDELKEAVGIVMDYKREDLLQKGLAGEYNAQIVKLIAESELGMINKVQVEHTGGEVTESQKKQMFLEYMKEIQQLPDGAIIDATESLDNK